MRRIVPFSLAVALATAAWSSDPSRCLGPASAPVEVLLDAGRVVEARSAARAEAAAMPDDRDAALDVARVELAVEASDEPASVDAELERIVATWPDAMVAHECLLERLRARGETERFLEALLRAARAVEPTPESADRLLRFVERYASERKYAEAAEACTRIISAFPHLGTVRARLARSLVDLGRRRQAEILYVEAMRQAPDDPSISDALVRCALAQDHLDVASDALAHWTRTVIANEHAELAVESLTQLEASRPAIPGLRLHLGDAHAALKHDADARKWWTACLTAPQDEASAKDCQARLAGAAPTK